MLSRYVGAYVAEHDAHFTNGNSRFKKVHEIGFAGTRYLAQESGVSYDTIRRLVSSPNYQQHMSLGLADEILAAMEMTYLISGDDPEIPILPNPRCWPPPKDEKERLARERNAERGRWYRSSPEVRAMSRERRRARTRKTKLDSAEAV